MSPLCGLRYYTLYIGIQQMAHRQTLSYPGSLRLDGQAHLLSPLGTIVLRELILLTLNKYNIFKVS